ETCLFRALRKPRPGADVLAYIAAKDPVLEVRFHIRRQLLVTQLDRPVGYAAPRVKLVRRDNRLRGTRFNAGRARAAMIRFNVAVVVKLDRQQQLAEEDP